MLMLHSWPCSCNSSKLGSTLQEKLGKLTKLWSTHHVMLMIQAPSDFFQPVSTCTQTRKWSCLRFYVYNRHRCHDIMWLMKLVFLAITSSEQLRARETCVVYSLQPHLCFSNLMKANVHYSTFVQWVCMHALRSLLLKLQKIIQKLDLHRAQTWAHELQKQSERLRAWQLSETYSPIVSHSNQVM